MIAFLYGIVEHKLPDSLILNVNNVGYEINISSSSYGRCQVGKPIKLHIEETVGMYGGGVTLYGFFTEEEKNIFISFKKGLKNTGAKKAMEYLDKATKSLPDFRRAVCQKDLKLLTSIFGFRQQTAEKIVALLQDKLSEVKIPGKEKWPKLTEEVPVETIQTLVALGYKESQAKKAVEDALVGLDNIPPLADLIKLTLKQV